MATVHRSWSPDHAGHQTHFGHFHAFVPSWRQFRLLVFSAVHHRPCRSRIGLSRASPSNGGRARVHFCACCGRRSLLAPCQVNRLESDLLRPRRSQRQEEKNRHDARSSRYRRYPAHDRRFIDDGRSSFLGLQKRQTRRQITMSFPSSGQQSASGFSMSVLIGDYRPITSLTRIHRRGMLPDLHGRRHPARR